ncbi:MAG: carboxypeptidase regulatory-like domain-containing protein, partial [Pyrinomonadaceae bacterium]|nr:carboxypeptidase regulatory-like domain-containing protein [Pyrinomonadaceae bacterium]
MNRHKSSTSYAAFLLTALFSLIIFNSTFAQTNLTSSVRGTVTDPQGGAVAGATVTLTSTDTNSARTQSTNEDGNFVFDLIPPGAYRLEAEATGFKKAALTDIRALIAKATEV